MASHLHLKIAELRVEPAARALRTQWPGRPRHPPHPLPPTHRHSLQTLSARERNENKQQKLHKAASLKKGIPQLTADNSALHQYLITDWRAADEGLTTDATFPARVNAHNTHRANEGGFAATPVLHLLQSFTHRVLPGTVAAAWCLHCILGLALGPPHFLTRLLLLEIFYHFM